MNQLNSYIVDKVVEITVSKLSSSNSVADKFNGQDVADFMQTIYDKLTQLYNAN